MVPLPGYLLEPDPLPLPPQSPQSNKLLPLPYLKIVGVGAPPLE